MRGWHLFTISGIDIEINYSWLFIFILLIFAISAQMALSVPGQPSWAVNLTGFAGAALLFASVLFHELAHSFMARWYGVDVARITLFIFGGVAQTKGEAPSGASEMLIAAIGPLSSLCLAGVLLSFELGLRQLPVNPLLPALAHEVGIINIFLAIFNLLPAFPLDGGRLLRASLWEWWGDILRSTRFASSLGRFFGYAMMLLGIYMTFTSGLLNGIWFLGLGWLLTSAATQSYQMVQVREALRQLTVAQAMRPLTIALNPDMSLRDAVAYYLGPQHLEAMPVAADGILLGVLNDNDLAKYAQTSWLHVSVRQAMTPLTDRAVVIDSLDLGAALEKMSGEELRRLIVVSKDGTLVGLLTQNDIAAAAQMLGSIGR